MNFTEDTTSGAEGLDWLARILNIDPQAVVVFITAFGNIELAVQAIKQGAADFVTKPWQNEKLLATISLALKLRKSKEHVEILKTQQRQLLADRDLRYQEIIGNSQQMQEVFRIIKKVAVTEANVLILGENGTGKELIARELHRSSHKAPCPFISVDMGAIAENLFESELFGHVKGAFTDAKSNRVGRFEMARQGTLFLDEIGNLALPLQAKLLKALEERQVIPVGSNTPRPIDVRLICATNAPIYTRVDKQEFRQDLFYRINTIVIELPPLRERKADIPLLVEEEGGRNRIDSVELADTAHPALPVKDLYPGESVHVDVPFELLSALIQRDADDLEPFSVVIFVNLFHIWHLLPARSTPRGPEIEEHHLALECTEPDLLPFR